jgi:restriction system protein
LFQLTSWQNDFVENFASRSAQRSLLVAPAGTGKTATALAASQRLIDNGAIDSLLIISDRVIIRDHWRDVATRFGIDLQASLERSMQGNGATVTQRSLETTGLIDVAAEKRRWLIVSDDAQDRDAAAVVVDRMLQSNSQSRALFISRMPQNGSSFDAEFSFGTETFLSQSIIAAPDTQIRVVTYSPSVALLQRLKNSGANIDSLNWREFEILVAALLEADGYAVELMQGTKDGGVDVIAVKDLGPNGYFKALWQAKKQSTKNKVGISVVRELADTRREFGASKGIIVTSSFLTRGALERIERDKYLLGKVDRNELQTWIDRTLLHPGGS